MDVGVVVDIGFLVLGDDGWLGCRLYLVGFVLIVLDIQVGDFQCVVFDEVMVWFDYIVYQGVEDLVGGDCVFDVYLQQVMGIWIDCGVLQLFWIYFVQVFEVLDLVVFFGFVQQLVVCL